MKQTNTNICLTTFLIVTVLIQAERYNQQQRKKKKGFM